MRTLVGMRHMYGRNVDGVLFHQGESDNTSDNMNASLQNRTTARYGERLAALADAVYAVGGASLYVSRTSRCGVRGPDSALRAVQLRVATSHPHARKGPDTDDL